MEEILQTALKRLEEADFAAFFSEIDKIEAELASHQKTLFNTYKQQFMHGKHGVFFNQQLAIFVKALLSDEETPIDVQDENGKKIIQSADKIYNIRHIDNAIFN